MSGAEAPFIVFAVEVLILLWFGHIYIRFCT